VRAAQESWQGEWPVRGWWWRESKKINKHSKPPRMYKNGRFYALIDLKIRRFLLKSTKQNILQRHFSRKTIILKFFFT
jgi:hypothetical protein